MIHVQKILYPTDFSSCSNQAYFHALALAEIHGASLTILHVYVPGFNSAELGSRDSCREQLEQIRPADAAIRVQHLLLDGDPAREIVRHAREGGIDLIVMGTHGRRGLERLLMGSVAEKVIRAAPCSVLVVKLPKGIPAAEKGKVKVGFNPA
jgi:nucleotide-binding universal stress UspA family protein